MEHFSKTNRCSCKQYLLNLLYIWTRLLPPSHFICTSRMRGGALKIAVKLPNYPWKEGRASTVRSSGTWSLQRWRFFPFLFFCLHVCGWECSSIFWVPVWLNAGNSSLSVLFCSCHGNPSLWDFFNRKGANKVGRREYVRLHRQR
jgi:hypothetical protein